LSEINNKELINPSDTENLVHTSSPSST